MSDAVSDIESIVHAVCADPPGYIIDDEETPWPPTDPHGANGHRYDMRCAICRSGDRPEALRELVQAVLDCVAATPATPDPEGAQQ